MFDKMMEKINAIMAKVGEMKNLCHERENRINELEVALADKELEVALLEDVIADREEVIANNEFDMALLEEALAEKVVVIAEQETRINELVKHGEIVNEEMMTLMGEIEVLRNKAVDEDALVEFERLIEALEEMVNDEN